MGVGERIKIVRLQKEMTLKELAEKIDVHFGSLSNIEKGSRNPSLEMLEKIAAALEVSLDRLTGESIGSAIEGRLEELNITMEELAERTKLSIDYLKSLDDIDPDGGDYNKVLYIAKALDMNPSLLRSALARQESPMYEGADESNVSSDFEIGNDPQLNSASVNDELTEADILTMAAHKVGHEGNLSDDEMDKIKLAIQIALAKKR